METTPRDSAKAYALTAQGECTITITQGARSVSWKALSTGGQTTFIVPAKAIASISDPDALLSPLPFLVAPERKEDALGGVPEMSIADAVFTPESHLPQSGTAVAEVTAQWQEASFARSALPGAAAVPPPEIWQEYGALMPHSIVGGVAYYDLSNMNIAANSRFITSNDIFYSLPIADGVEIGRSELRFGLGRSDIKKMYVLLGQVASGNSAIVLNAPEADIFVSSNTNSSIALSCVRPRAYASIAKSIKLYAPNYNTETFIFSFSNTPENFREPTTTPFEAYLPACTAVTNIGGLANEVDYYRRNHMPLKLCMPALKKSCSFCTRMAMGAESLVYFLTHVGTQTAFQNGGTIPLVSGSAPTITLGVDAALGHIEDGTPVWEETEEAQAVATAVQAAIERGWNIGIIFNEKIG